MCYIDIWNSRALLKATRTDFKNLLRDMANVPYLSAGGDAIHLQDRVLPRPLLALPQLPAQVLTLDNFLLT